MTRLMLGLGLDKLAGLFGPGYYKLLRNVGVVENNPDLLRRHGC